MTPGEEKQQRLITRYVDGWAWGMKFLEAHQLLLAWGEGSDMDRLRSRVIDFEESSVVRSKAPPQPILGGLLSETGLNGIEAESFDGWIDVRTQKGKLIKRFSRTGKRPGLRFSPDGQSLFSAATEVLNRWNLKTGKALATIGNLLAAQNKEGVISIFDLAKAKRLVCVRPSADGWIAFDDDGAWDASDGEKRGAELSWTDAKSTAFVPGQGYGWLELNRFPMSRVVPPKEGRVKGLIALRTRGYW